MRQSSNRSRRGTILPGPRRADFEVCCITGLLAWLACGASAGEERGGPNGLETRGATTDPVTAGRWGEEDDMLDEDAFRIPMWNCATELRGSFGYRDNVLLSHSRGQGSAFWMSGADLMLFRLPSRGWHFHFFADASDTRYFDSPSVDNEQLAIAAAQAAREFDNGWKSALSFNYLYQNQVFDFSNVYTNQASVGQVLGHAIAPRWSLRKTIHPFWMEGELSGTRQWLDEPLDSFWQFGPRMTIGSGWGRGSEIRLSYQYARIDYDARLQADASGGVITNTSLALNSHAAELAVTHGWDEPGRWQTITSLGYEATLDNGSGFYDFENYRISQQLRYRDENWEVTARARLGWFEYSTQTVSVTDRATRSRTLVNVSVRVERKVAKHLKLHASYGWDRSISNLEFDDYEASTVLGGAALTF